MADQLYPEYEVAFRAAEKRKKLADVLRAQSMRSTPGQMAGDIYVAPSWTEGLARLLQAKQASKIDREASDRELQLARALGGWKKDVAMAEMKQKQQEAERLALEKERFAMMLNADPGQSLPARPAQPGEYSDRAQQFDADMRQTYGIGPVPASGVRPAVSPTPNTSLGAAALAAGNETIAANYLKPQKALSPEELLIKQKTADAAMMRANAAMKNATDAPRLVSTQYERWMAIVSENERKRAAGEPIDAKEQYDADLARFGLQRVSTAGTPESGLYTIQPKPLPQYGQGAQEPTLPGPAQPVPQDAPAASPTKPASPVVTPVPVGAGGVTNAGLKDVRALKVKLAGINEMSRNLENMRTKLSNVGFMDRFVPGEKKAELQASFVNLVSGVQQHIMNTGVLQPGEWPLIEKIIADPTKFFDSLWRTGGVKGIQAQIDEIERRLQSKKTQAVEESLVGDMADDPEIIGSEE